MDIQISSNFERLLFEAYGRDGAAVRRLMASLAQSGAFAIEPEPLARIRAEFDGARRSTRPRSPPRWPIPAREPATCSIRTRAVGIRAAPRAARAAIRARPWSRSRPPIRRSSRTRSSAATGVRPALPPHLADLMERPERFTVLPNDQGAVEPFIRERARAVRGVAA